MRITLLTLLAAAFIASCSNINKQHMSVLNQIKPHVDNRSLKTNFRSLAANITNFKKVKEQLCTPLDIGSSVIVDFRRRYLNGSNKLTASKTGIERKYLLKRLNKKTWEIGFNIKYLTDSEFDGYGSHIKKKSTRDKVANLYYQNLLNSCLKKANNIDFLKDKLGRKLILNNYSNSVISNKIPLIKIKISKKNIGSSQDKIRSNPDCREVIHELLHFTSLVDEYKTDEGNSCRHSGPLNSIMNKSKFYEGAFKQSDRARYGEKIVGACLCNDSSCPVVDREEMNIKNYWDFCPRNFSEISISDQNLNFYKKNSITDIKKYGNDNVNYWYGNYGKGTFIIYTHSPVGELALEAILPAHINSIIYPECTMKNHIYFSCSSNAYINPGQACLPTPKDCENDDWLYNIIE